MLNKLFSISSNNYFGDNNDSPSIEFLTQNPISELQPNVLSQRANCNSDIESFTGLFKKLLDDTWEDGWGEFTVEAPTNNSPDKIAVPKIVFKVNKRIPSINKKGVKTRQVEINVDPDNSDYALVLSRKWFDCEVSFLIIHKTNLEVARLMNRLESFIETYTGYFKQNGLSEIIFLCEDNTNLKARALEGIPSKCLKYLIVLERISVERIRTTKEVRSQIEAFTS